MLKIAICDDQPKFLSELEAMLLPWTHTNQHASISCFSDGDALLVAHTATPFDIIFLDIVMPLSNGIEIAREIRETDKRVRLVFLTSSPEYAVESYTVKADNYLLKPIQPKTLFHCLDELLETIQQISRSITVRTSLATHRLELRTIEFVEAQNKHTIFALSNGQHIESIDSLHTFEHSFPLTDGFFRCHRSYIVNFDHIALFTQNEIKLRSGTRIPIARSCQKEFQAAYFSDVFRKAGEGRD